MILHFLVLNLIVCLFSIMKCLTPYRKKNPQYPEFSDLRYIDCACGKCYPCLVNRRNSWLFRLEHESLCSSSTWFITLTYDDVSCDGSLHRDHLTKFLKSLRHFVRFKFYAIGEFGTTTFRPHYHICLFAKSFHFIPTKRVLDDDFSEIISKLWRYGFVSVSRANSASLNYVLHYHVRPKRPFGKDDPRKTFFACSKRLGLDFLFNSDGSFRHDIVVMLSKSSNRVVSDYFGRSFVLPRYYVKKAEELGLLVFKPDFSSIDWSNSNTLDYIRVLFPDIEVDPNTGYPLNMSVDMFNSLHDQFRRDSSKKLRKYNYQTKTSV